MSELAAGTGEARFRPIKLATIDVENVPDAIDGGPGYGALLALVREHDRPRGMIRVPFEDGSVSRGQLAVAIAALPATSDPSVPRRPPENLLPRISVVVPSLLEREEGLQACLRSLAELDYPNYEVIVVDNRPAGAPPVDLPGVRVVRETRPGISAARNRGLEEVTGEIVAFTDDDVEVDPGWLLAIATRLTEHPEEACVNGLALPRELETSAQVALEEYYGGFGPRSFDPSRTGCARRTVARSWPRQPSTRSTTAAACCGASPCTPQEASAPARIWRSAPGRSASSAALTPRSEPGPTRAVERT